MVTRDIAAIVKPLSPTAVRILLVLLLGRGQSFTGRELARMLGKSANTISAAVNELEYLGYAQNNGRQHGWSLPAQWKQLDLWPGNNGGARVEDVPVVSALPALHGEETEKPTIYKPNLSTTRAAPVDKLIQKNLEFQKNLDFAASSSSFLEEREEEEEEIPEEETGEFQKNLDLESVCQALVAVGIGRRSRKMREILELDPNPAWVEAHIAAWHERDEPTGFLITRLLCGEPPPVVRRSGNGNGRSCPECGGKLDQEGNCLFCLGVITR